MPSLADVEAAFLKADQAGDTPAATALAGEVRRLRSQTSAPRAAPPPDPSEGGGTLRFGPLDTGIKTSQGVDRVLAGAGKAMADTARGAGQFLGLVSRDDVAETRKRDAPLMATGAGLAGNLLGNVAMVAPTALIPGANTVAGAGAIGAAAGALQPSTSTGETLANIGLGGAGGAAGQKVANMIGGAARAAGTQVSRAQGTSAAGGNALGMRLTPGKASGSPALQKVEAALESNPVTSAGFDSIKETNQKALNRAAAKSIGEKADELGTAQISAAEQRIGGVFDRVADKTPAALDPKIVPARLKQIADDAEGLIGGNGSLADNPLWKRLDEFTFQGGASREQLRTLSSKLGKAARTNMTTPAGDRELGSALFKAQEVVEDAIVDTLKGAEKAAYSEARGQYRNLMNLTAKTNVVNPSNGQVNGRALATTLMQKDRGGFTMGRNDSDLYEAARFVQAFPDIVGNSGTATRSRGAADYLASLPANLLTRAYLSAPVGAAAAAGAGAAGLGARLVNRPVNLLGRPAGGAIGITNWSQQ